MLEPSECFSFVGRYDFIEVAAEDVLCGKGYELTLFLFTDILLIAKKKTGKMGGMIRSPSNMSIASGHVTLQTKVFLSFSSEATIYILDVSICCH